VTAPHVLKESFERHGYAGNAQILGKKARQNDTQQPLQYSGQKKSLPSTQIPPAI
jgi:hypothetical protein